MTPGGETKWSSTTLPWSGVTGEIAASAAAAAAVSAAGRPPTNQGSRERNERGKSVDRVGEERPPTTPAHSLPDAGGGGSPRPSAGAAAAASARALSLPLLTRSPRSMADLMPLVALRWPPSLTAAPPRASPSIGAMTPSAVEDEQTVAADTSDPTDSVEEGVVNHAAAPAAPLSLAPTSAPPQRTPPMAIVSARVEGESGATATLPPASSAPSA